MSGAAAIFCTCCGCFPCNCASELPLGVTPGPKLPCAIQLDFTWATVPTSITSSWFGERTDAGSPAPPGNPETYMTSGNCTRRWFRFRKTRTFDVPLPTSLRLYRKFEATLGNTLFDDGDAGACSEVTYIATWETDETITTYLEEQTQDDLCRCGPANEQPDPIFDLSAMEGCPEGAELGDPPDLTQTIGGLWTGFLHPDAEDYPATVTSTVTYTATVTFDTTAGTRTIEVKRYSETIYHRVDTLLACEQFAVSLESDVAQSWAFDFSASCETVDCDPCPPCGISAVSLNPQGQDWEFGAVGGFAYYNEWVQDEPGTSDFCCGSAGVSSPGTLTQYSDYDNDGIYELVETFPQTRGISYIENPDNPGEYGFLVSYGRGARFFPGPCESRSFEPDSGVDPEISGITFTFGGASVTVRPPCDPDTAIVGRWQPSLGPNYVETVSVTWLPGKPCCLYIEYNDDTPARIHPCTVVDVFWTGTTGIRPATTRWFQVYPNPSNNEFIFFKENNGGAFPAAGPYEGFGLNAGILDSAILTETPCG